MYLLFAYHHVLPSVYYNMEPGEQEVVRAFMHYQIERMNEETEEMTHV